MKKLLGIFSGFILFATPAFAGVPCTPLPFNLQNGQVADATQVMANYNFIVNCLANAAGAGANTDITSLGGLTTPLPPAQGGTTTFVGNSASAGSANAQIVAGTTPSNFSLTNNGKVIFKAGFTNTGFTTLNVNGTGAIIVGRRVSEGLEQLAGGEIIVGTVVEVVFDGTFYQLMSNVVPFPVGTVLETIATVADTGFVLMQGQCVSNSGSGIYGALFIKMGSPAPTGGCVAGQFQIPDGRGRVVAMPDSGGSGNISICSSTLYTSCGLQSETLNGSQIPTISGTTGAGTAHSHSVFIRDPTHTHSVGVTAALLSVTGPGVSAPGNGATITGASSTGIHANAVNGGGSGTDDVTATESGHTHSITLGSASPSIVPTIQPTLFLNRQIRY